MNKLERLLYDLEIEKQKQHFNLPDTDMCKCIECGWKGKVNDCEEVEEYIGMIPEGRWEIFHLCPKCNESNIEYFSSKKSIKKWEQNNKYL